jgi:dihydroflavonol-4-reductase
LILVTGGTGFLGRNLLPILLDAGYPVRLISRQPEKYPWLRDLNVEVVTADVVEREKVFAAMQGVRYVVHGAGLFRFWGQTSDFEQTNIRGTQNILEAAAQVGIEKLVHVSTIAVAGYPRDPQRIIDEAYVCQPMDDYQRSKAAGEQQVLDAVRELGVPAVIVRGGAFYGPHGRYAFNKLFFEDPLINHLPMGVDGGRHLTFPAYIKDVARGLLLGLEKGRPGEVYNVSSQTLKHREVERIIARISGTSAFRLHAPRVMMVQVARLLTWLTELTGRERRYVLTMEPYIFGEWNVSIEKARQELGFQPTSFEQGVRETLQWYIDEGLWKSKRPII